MNSKQKFKTVFGDVYKTASEPLLDPHYAARAGGLGGSNDLFHEYITETTGNPVRANDYTERLQLARILGWPVGALPGGAAGYGLSKAMLRSPGVVPALFRMSGAGLGAMGGGQLGSGLFAGHTAKELAKEHNIGQLGYDPNSKVNQLQKALQDMEDKSKQTSKQLSEAMNKITHKDKTLADLLGHKKGPFEGAGEWADRQLSNVGEKVRDFGSYVRDLWAKGDKVNA